MLKVFATDVVISKGVRRRTGSEVFGNGRIGEVSVRQKGV